MFSNKNKEETLNHLLKIINERKVVYGKAVFRTVLSRNGDQVSLHCGRVDFSHKLDQLDKDVIYDYGTFIFVRQIFNIDDFLKILSTLISTKSINLNGVSPISVECGLNDGDHQISSKTHFSSIYNEWPLLLFRCSGNNTMSPNSAYDPLVRVGLPTFPTLYQGAQHFLGLEDRANLGSSTEIQILLSDYSARIKVLEITDNNIRMAVEKNELAYDKLLTKFFCKKGLENFPSDDMRIQENGIVEFNLKFVPDQVDAYLIERETGRIIDFRNYGGYTSANQDGIIVKTSHETIESFLANGEGQGIEFKTELSNEFLETIIAFANTNDGTIILGVDNRNRVVGFNEDFEKAEKRIKGMILGNCEPKIEVIIEGREVDHRPILIVKVKKGNDQPYILRNKGPYVRHEDKDVLMTRHELDRIYGAKYESARYPRGLI